MTHHTKSALVVDAVGVVDHPKVSVGTLDCKRSIPFGKLLEQISWGVVSEDAFTSLAARLARLEKDLTAAEREAIRQASGGQSPRELAHALLDAVDPDLVSESAREAGLVNPTPEQLAEAQTRLMQAAAAPFNSFELRERLTNIQKQQVIHTALKDRLLEADYSVDATERARGMVGSFRDFLIANRDEITALQLLFSQPFHRQAPTLEQIEELKERIEQPPNTWTTESLWRAYAQLEKDKVRGARTERVLTDLVSLVRHALQLDDELIPYLELVRGRYDDWLAAQESGGRAFTAGQRWWLDRIAEAIGLNLSMTPQDFQHGELRDRGGLFAAQRLFDGELMGVLEELNETLTVRKEIL